MDVRLMQEECRTRGRQVEEVSSQLAAEKDRHSRLAMEAAANSKSRDAAALHEKTQELSQLKQQLDRSGPCKQLMRLYLTKEHAAFHNAVDGCLNARLGRKKSDPSLSGHQYHSP